MMTKLCSVTLALVLVALAGVATAQEKPVDPRLAGPQIQALAAMVALREAQIRTMSEDFRVQLAAHEKDWQETFKAWCAERPACGLTTPAAAKSQSRNR